MQDCASYFKLVMKEYVRNHCDFYSFFAFFFFSSTLFPQEIMEFMELLHHGYYNISAQFKTFRIFYAGILRHLDKVFFGVLCFIQLYFEFLLHILHLDFVCLHLAR